MTCKEKLHYPPCHFLLSDFQTFRNDVPASQWGPTALCLKLFQKNCLWFNEDIYEKVKIFWWRRRSLATLDSSLQCKKKSPQNKTEANVRPRTWNKTCILLPTKKIPESGQFFFLRNCSFNLSFTNYFHIQTFSHHRRWTRDDVKGLLEDSGFRY